MTLRIIWHNFLRDIWHIDAYFNPNDQKASLRIFLFCYSLQSVFSLCLSASQPIYRKPQSTACRYPLIGKSLSQLFDEPLVVVV